MFQNNPHRVHGEVAFLPVVFLVSLFFSPEVTLTFENIPAALRVTMETEHSSLLPPLCLPWSGTAAKTSQSLRKGGQWEGEREEGKPAALNQIIPVQSGSPPLHPESLSS